MQLTENDIERIRDMIRIHESNTGKKPLVVQYGTPQGLKVCGVEVKFWNEPKFFTCDKDSVLHHKFEDIK